MDREEGHVTVTKKSIEIFGLPIAVLSYQIKLQAPT